MSQNFKTTNVARKPKKAVVSFDSLPSNLGSVLMWVAIFYLYTLQYTIPVWAQVLVYGLLGVTAVVKLVKAGGEEQINLFD